MPLARPEAAPVEAFFRSYCAAFERYDVNALAEHFLFPAHIASDNDAITLTALSSAEDYARLIAPLLTLYRKLGVASGRIAATALTTLIPRLVHARVDWEICAEQGRVLYAHRALYTLVAMDAGLKLCAICVNEMPALRACLESR
jgi:hypothetical protein